MWSVWLVFCDCGFQSVCPLMEKDKRLMEASWWERLTVGKTGSCSDGQAMLSKSLIQFSVDGWGCCLAWGQIVDPHLYWRLLDTHREIWLSLLWGHFPFLLASCAHKILFVVLQESVSSVLWNFCNQISLASKVKFPGGSQTLWQISRLGNPLWVLELLNSARISFDNFSVVCGLSAQWLYDGANGDLLQEGLCPSCLMQVCCSQGLHPRSRPLLTRASAGDTQTVKGRCGSVSYTHTHTHTHVCMCMYFHIFFIYSSISGHLGCFHILAIINNAALNIRVHIHLFELVFCFRKIYRSGIAGSLGFPGGSDSKESAYNAGDLSSFPGSGRSPGGGNGYPLQYSCLENSMDRGGWWVTVHGVAKSCT